MKQSQALTFFVLILINFSLISSIKYSKHSPNAPRHLTSIKSFGRDRIELKNRGKAKNTSHKPRGVLNVPHKTHKTIHKARLGELDKLKAYRKSMNIYKSSPMFTEKNSRYVNPFRKASSEQVFNGSTYEGWLTVQSEALNTSRRYPLIPGIVEPPVKLPIDQESKLINMLWKKDQKNEMPSKYFLWARLKGKYLYFTNSNKTDEHILFYINTANIVGVENLKDENYCLNVNEGENKWTFCSENLLNTDKWVCLISATVRGEDPKKECESAIKAVAAPKIIEKTIEQPYIVIPIPQEYCNAKWDYSENGNNWECNCKEGKEQSPIDLPPPNKAVSISAKPIFDYSIVDPIHKESSSSGKFKAGQPLKMEHDHGALKIFHSNLGKVVTMDGTIYFAEEIVFHTPSEHTINGEKFPMEMQVIHRAKTKGDYGKQLYLSFLFKGKAGKYNKLIDSLDFFSIPNPHDKEKKLYEKLFIPNVLLSADDSDSTIFQPFNFYTYQGSETAPPCAERVIHYVASDPIELSTTALEMFKEGLRVPDFQDADGNVIQSPTVTTNNSRTTQPLNGRAVFHYNFRDNGEPSFKKEETPNYAPKGHYEKQVKESTQYFYVEGNKPSGVPGAIVVSDDEANK